MTRIGLFLGTNLAVIFVLTMILNILGLNQPGMSWTPYLIMAAVMGMGGSFISLLMSKSAAKRSVGAQVIENPRNQIESWLMETVRKQAQQAGIGMPEVAIFDSSAPNAFATGANKNAALVAVSTGLLHNMNQAEVEAVLAHEISHVANGDMVTLSLIQGVVNTFVMVLSRVVSTVVDRQRGGGGRMGYYATYMITQTVLGFLATMIVRWFSRWREYRADSGAAELAGREHMIAALERLGQGSQPAQLPASMQAFGISGGILKQLGLKKLFATHPPLEDRIAALRGR